MLEDLSVDGSRAEHDSVFGFDGVGDHGHWVHVSERRQLLSIRMLLMSKPSANEATERVRCRILLLVQSCCSNADRNAKAVAKKHNASAALWDSNFSPDQWQNLSVQPLCALRRVARVVWDGQDRAAGSIAGSVDGDERHTKAVACDRCGVFGIGVELLAVVAASVQADYQRLELGRSGDSCGYRCDS